MNIKIGDRVRAKETTMFDKELIGTMGTVVETYPFRVLFDEDPDKEPWCMSVDELEVIYNE